MQQGCQAGVRETLKQLLHTHHSFLHRHLYCKHQLQASSEPTCAAYLPVFCAMHCSSPIAHFQNRRY